MGLGAKAALNNTDVSAVAEQCLHSAKTFCVSCCPPAHRLRVPKKLGCHTARTADPDGPRGVPCPAVLCSAITAGGKEEVGGCSELQHLLNNNKA